uniref:Uncharacterized protein n=1 Tax=Yersinia enterocolitica W22703 TaxID=913028 RepID=F4N862_YEREN|nr:unknown protein [Yersinia enterocolitica W22703]
MQVAFTINAFKFSPFHSAPSNMGYSLLPSGDTAIPSNPLSAPLENSVYHPERLAT